MYRLLLAFLLLPSLAWGQKLFDRNAYAHFYSSTPLEDIEAVNNKAMGVIDMSTGEVAVSMNMVDFEFEKSLMQEHFNENYVESDKYPKAVFTGSISDFDAEDVTDASDTVFFQVVGNMTIHGVTNEVSAEVKFFSDQKMLSASTAFTIVLEDYDVDIPKIVMMNIAERVAVTARFVFDLSK